MATITCKLRETVSTLAWMSPYLGGTCITSPDNYMVCSTGDKAALYIVNKYTPCSLKKELAALSNN